jgi:hypothetical protein
MCGNPRRYSGELTRQEQLAQQLDGFERVDGLGDGVDESAI